MALKAQIFVPGVGYRSIGTISVPEFVNSDTSSFASLLLGENRVGLDKYVAIYRYGSTYVTQASWDIPSSTRIADGGINGINLDASAGPLRFITNNIQRIHIQNDGQIFLYGAVISSEAVTVPDEAYSSSWDGSTEVPTKNAIYDKIESLVTGGGGGAVNDTTYGVSWDGDTTTAPSKNAVYDKFESLQRKFDGGNSASLLLTSSVSVFDGGTSADLL